MKPVTQNTLMKTTLSVWQRNGLRLLRACAAIGLLLAGCAAPRHALAEPTPKAAPTDALARVETYWKKRLPGYMEGASEAMNYPGWEGYPTRKHRYKVSDGKTAEVIMCNADARQLARWIVTACIEARGSADPKYTDELCRQIMEASGAQYPVAGIVLEDMDGKAHAIYAFRDGVTVRIEGIENGAKKQPTAEQISSALDPTVKPTAALKYARIQSTTREEYRAAGGKEDVDGLRWLDVSRKLYQEAWGKDRNELMIAWAKANLSKR